MARVLGPLMSLAASGTLADILTYSNTNGRNTVRRKPIPTGEQTPTQRSVRAMVTWLSQSWAQWLTDAERATWDALTTSDQPTPFNAYMKFNLDRWRRNRSPSVNPTLTGGTTLSTYAVLPTLTPEGRGATYRITVGTIDDSMGQQLHMSKTNNFLPSRSTLVFINGGQDTTPTVQYLPDLPRGTWYWRTRDWGRKGSPSTTETLHSITIP